MSLHLPSLVRTVLLAFLLAGCDQMAATFGIESPGIRDARAEAEGKAVGSACRHSGRAIEDCYSIYGWLPKASVFEGWREMDAYMRENQIETIAPQLPPPEPPKSARSKKRPAAGTSESTPPPAATEPPPAGQPAAAGGQAPAAQPDSPPAATPAVDTTQTLAPRTR